MLDSVLQRTENQFVKVLDHLKGEYSHLQIGRASAALVEHLVIDAYGSKQPLKGIGSISVPDPKTVQIQPWDRSLLVEIEKAIRNSDLNLAPMNDGVVIRLNLPPLTEERRKDLAKVVGKMAEEARISIRHARQEMNDEMKKLEKEGKVTEDQLHSFEKRLQERVDKVNLEIETISRNKERDIMTV